MVKNSLLSSILLLTLSAATSHAAVVINEIYSGGGSSSATAAYQTDFIELYNNGTVDVVIAGYRLDYGSGSSVAGTFATPVGVLPVGATIAAGGYYLIQTGNAGTGGAADVTPDVDFSFVSGVSGASLSNTSGAVRLQDDLLAILDVVGWGTVNNFETTAESAPASVAVSLQRTTVGVDTNNNQSDFSQSAPTPMAGAVAIPEPSRFVLLGLGALGLILRRRRA